MNVKPMNSLRTSSLVLAVAFSVLIAGCIDAGEMSDAYGNFEADDTIVSAEGGGKLIAFDVREGEVIPSGLPVATVDTVQLSLQRDQLRASQAAVRARIPGVVAEIEVLEEEKRVASIEKTRIDNLLARNAATKKQKDDIEGRIAVIDRRIRSIRSRHAPILAEVEVLNAQISQVENQIEKHTIMNPVAGTVLETYANLHEIVATGRPLYKIAPTDTLVLRAFVSGAQLGDFALGQEVRVFIDRDATSNTSLSGRITWLASEAEFTPRMIQTKDERVNLMYALKVLVPNPDGVLKIGMPGEVVFSRNVDAD